LQYRNGIRNKKYINVTVLECKGMIAGFELNNNEHFPNLLSQNQGPTEHVPFYCAPVLKTSMLDIKATE
jgi:hypothetical protein